MAYPGLESRMTIPLVVPLVTVYSGKKLVDFSASTGKKSKSNIRKKLYCCNITEKAKSKYFV
jgi:nitroimidazol reductase NimA-like FMN-containing flavoprotein (pyridoxamine 5'-phosphate oxidase superfamily)